MKKYFMAAVAAMMMMVSPVMAQNNVELCKNEVSASVGFGNAVQMFEGFTSALVGKNDVSGASFNIDYSHRLGRKVSLGVTLNYFGGAKISNEYDREQYYGVMPHIKLDYINKKGFTLYGKAAVGLLVNTCQEKNNGKMENKTNTWTGFQISPLGVELGPDEHFRVFGELGLGMAGTAQLGLRYKF